MPRGNKSKGEIVSDIQLVTDAERRRALVRDIIFPHLTNIGESVGYSKVFLQAFSALITGIFDDTARTTTISQLSSKVDEKLHTIFKVKDKKEKAEYERYSTLVEKLKDVSVQDLTYAMELPRFIDGFLLKDKNKAPINDIPIDEILG